MIGEIIAALVTAYFILVLSYWPIVLTINVMAHLADISLSKATDGDLNEVCSSFAYRFRRRFRKSIGLLIEDDLKSVDCEDIRFLGIVIWMLLSGIWSAVVGGIGIARALVYDYTGSYPSIVEVIMEKDGFSSMLEMILSNVWEGMFSFSLVVYPFLVAIALWKLLFWSIGKVYLINKTLRDHIEDDSIHNR